MYPLCEYTLLWSVQPPPLLSLTPSLSPPIFQHLSIHIVISENRKDFHLCYTNVDSERDFCTFVLSSWLHKGSFRIYFTHFLLRKPVLDILCLWFCIILLLFPYVNWQSNGFHYDSSIHSYNVLWSHFLFYYPFLSFLPLSPFYIAKFPFCFYASPH
jgi:hypothetical protein